MPLVVPTTPSALPTPPSTSDPTNFDTRADAFLSALPTNQTQVNQLALDTYTNASYSQTQANSALASANTAAVQAASAAASAASAALASGAAKWVTGTTYSNGNVVWSPTTYQTYRCKYASPTVSNTDPALDGTNWAQLMPPSTPIQVTGTSVTVTPYVQYILLNTGAITTVTLPPTPTIGDLVPIDNATGRFDGIINNNGNYLFGLLETCTIDLSGPFTLRFYGGTIGWRLT